MLSGRDFSPIDSFASEKPRVAGAEACASPGDMDGDGAADLVLSCATGAGATGYASFVSAISSEDGAIIWQVSGDEMPGGAAGFTVDARTGERAELAPDVGFGGQVVALPDLDDDGIGEVATMALVPIGGRRRRAVLVFSGANGNVLATVGTEQVRFPERRSAQQIVLLLSADGQGRPGLAVYGTTAGKKEAAHAIAVFLLRNSS